MADGATSVLTPQDLADLRTVQSRSKPGVPHRLNLADESEWRFLQRVLAQSGVSPTRNPEMTRVIQELRQHHQSNGGPEPDDVSATDAPIIDQNMFSSIGVTQSTQAPLSSAFSSIVGGTTYSMLYMELFDENGNPLGNNSNVQYGQGTYVPVAAQGTPPRNPGFQAQFTYAYQKKSGGQPVVNTMFLDAAAEPLGPPTLTQPVRTPDNINKAHQYIKVGLGRNSQDKGDCDYWYNEPQNIQQNPILKVPIVATQQFASNVTTVVQAALAVTGPLSGGGIVLPSTSQLLDHIKANGTTLNITFPFNENKQQDQSATFPPAQWPPDQMSTITFTVFVKTQNSGNNLVAVSIYSNLTPPWTGDPGAPSIDGVYVLRPIDFTWHCVAAGTLVKMADGSERAIEDLRGGEEVVIDTNGGTLIVNDTYVVQKDAKLIEITDEFGHRLLATERHAIITQDGPLLAQYLLPEHTLFTERGPARITSIERVPYKGLVFAINVGRGFRLEDIPEGNLTFFANGILVGDNNLCRRTAATARAQLANILAELPPAWHPEATTVHGSV